MITRSIAAPSPTIRRFHVPADTGWCRATRYPQEGSRGIAQPTDAPPARARVAAGSLRRRHLTGRVRRRGRPSSRQGQLAFPGNPLKGFRRAFDPVLAIVSFRRKLADDLVGAIGCRTRDIARGEIDNRPNGELVFQRPLLLACRQEPLGPAARAGESLINVTRIACRRPPWPAASRHGKRPIVKRVQQDRPPKIGSWAVRRPAAIVRRCAAACRRGSHGRLRAGAARQGSGTAGRSAR